MAKAFRIFALVAVLSLLLLAIPLPLANVAIANGVTAVWVAPPPFGNDCNPGTQAQPFATIQKGIDTLELGSGGTVHVAAGTYYENLLISEAVNLTGAGAQNTIIDGADSGHVIVISSAPDTENIISGFTIQNGRYAASLWNPTDEQVLYAGLNLRFLRMLPQPSAILLGGGGILIGDTHIVYLNDCVIKNNISQRGGGITNTGQLHMNRCTVSGNTATDQGGGIFNYYNPTGPGDSGKMWLTDCTISGNQVTEFDFSGGGGIYNENGVMELLNCTIAYNSTSSFSGTAGGGFYNYSSHTAYFKNTIVANNTAGNDLYNNGCSSPAEATVSQGYNLDSENSCGFNQPTDLRNTNPLLGPLQDNGGPTFTHALLEGSPAIDAGTCTGAPATDQRGVTRPQGENCDIGAYEYEPEEEEAAIPPAKRRVSPSIPTPPHPLNPPQMLVQYLSVNPQQTTANQPVTITTNVVNTGDEAGNINITLTINGQVEQSRMVSVGPQGTQPIEFTVTKAQPGTYNVNILDKSGSFTILGAGGTTGAPVNSGLIVILIIGVLVVATVLILILSRRPA
jgi:hypothetical protein